MAGVDEPSGLGSAALDLLGAAQSARPPKRGHLFSAQRQPTQEQHEQAKRRRLAATEYIQDDAKRRATLNRHLKTLEKRIKHLESSTGASFVCVALPGGAHGGAPRVIGNMGSALMRGVYSAPGAAQLRSTILEEEAAAAPPPVPPVPPASNSSTGVAPRPLRLRKMKAPVMIKQLRTLLPAPGQLPGTDLQGAQLGQHQLRPEEWWPSAGAAAAADGTAQAGAVQAVRLSDKYSLKQMSVGDLQCVYDAFSRHLVKRAAATAAAAAVAAGAMPSGADSGERQAQLQPHEQAESHSSPAATGAASEHMAAPLAGEVLDQRPAVLREDIEHQMITRWRVAHPTEAAAIIAEAEREAQERSKEQAHGGAAAAIAESAAAIDDAEAVLPGGAGRISPMLLEGLGSFELDGPTWRPEDNLDLGLGGAGLSDEEEYSYEDEEEFSLETFDDHDEDAEDDEEGGG